MPKTRAISAIFEAGDRRPMSSSGPVDVHLIEREIASRKPHAVGFFIDDLREPSTEHEHLHPPPECRTLHRSIGTDREKRAVDAHRREPRPKSFDRVEALDRSG